MKTKMTAIFATLMITLMLAGVSYAMWEKTMTITGTVNTGEMDVQFCNVAVSSDEAKKVSSWSAVVTDPEHITVTIDNAYPCIWYTIDADINNVGTIPVIIQSITVTDLPSYAEYTLTGAVVGDQIDTPAMVKAGVPDAVDTVPFDIGIHLLNDPMTPMNSGFTFTVTIQCVQYNEYA
ncbi:MAG: hypothetical protein OEY30_00550 [Candidatus Bathyarchaeota archaeon]|nr:hypothetical protein [Candidatus Bathyarchaeota archaeon]